MLQELQRLESRLQPFLQRYYEVLGAAATTDYNNNVRTPPQPRAVLPRWSRVGCTSPLPPSKTVSLTEQFLSRFGDKLVLFSCLTESVMLLMIAAGSGPS